MRQEDAIKLRSMHEYHTKTKFPIQEEDLAVPLSSHFYLFVYLHQKNIMLSKQNQHQQFCPSIYTIEMFRCFCFAFSSFHHTEEEEEEENFSKKVRMKIA